MRAHTHDSAPYSCWHKNSCVDSIHANSEYMNVLYILSNVYSDLHAFAVYVGSISTGRAVTLTERKKKLWCFRHFRTAIFFFLFFWSFGLQHDTLTTPPPPLMRHFCQSINRKYRGWKGDFAGLYYIYGTYSPGLLTFVTVSGLVSGRKKMESLKLFFCV